MLWILGWAAVYAGSATIVILLADTVLRFFNMQEALKRQRHTVFLEITPPAYSEKTALATQHLFAVIHDMFLGRQFRDRILDRHNAISLEITSTRAEGIRYLIKLPKRDASVLQRAIASYLPDARFAVLHKAPRPGTQKNGYYRRVLEFHQYRHFAYPLRAQEELSQHDPVAYIAGAMTKLTAGEITTLQLILAPYTSWRHNRLTDRFRSGESVRLEGNIKYILLRRLPLWLVIAGAIGYWRFDYGVVALLVGIFTAVLSHHFDRHFPAQRTTAEQTMHDQTLAKLDQEAFRADIRMYIEAETNKSFYEHQRSALASLAPLAMPGFQQLYVRRARPYHLWQKFSAFKFHNRLSSFWPSESSIMAASELADIYHFPYADTSRTENLVRSHSRTLPAPVSMKANPKFDVILGLNKHHDEATPIGLTAAERERHVFIIGGTGNGKTTLLQYAIVQDIQNGKGVAVVDPHGDMAETLLRHVPEERINDVIYFNPDDLAHPIGLNLLELTPGLTGDELLREKDLVTESVVSIFRKIFSDDDTGGHRIEYVLRNTIQTALTIEDATLFTMYDLLVDPAYRKKVVATLDNKDLVNFWKNELGKAGDFQKVKMAAGITAKIGRFLFSASAKRILEQPRSTINFDDILDGKILICNFSKGLLGEDTSELFGIAVLAKIQLASLRRARLKQTDRKPFYLYVDEFQNFATPSFVQMLSEARKYKLYLTMAEQSTSQQEDPQMVNVILANVGTVVCFRSGNPADEELVLPIFKPYVEEGEIANLPSYNFYMRVSAQKSQEPLSGETIVLGGHGSDKNASKVIARSISRYTISKPTTGQHTSKNTKLKPARATIKRPGDKE